MIFISIIDSFNHGYTDKPEKSFEAFSKYTNEKKSLKIMDVQNFKSALVVTRDYHLKSSKLIYNRISDGQHNLRYIAALSTRGKIWKEKSHADVIWFKEFYKLCGYRLGFYKFLDVLDKT